MASKCPLYGEAKYLGCFLDDHMDSTQELKKRMALCSLVWRKLDSSWLHSHCSPKYKLLAYDS
eukprot:12923733-Prorocentrum_lima.AAC.1